MAVVQRQRLAISAVRDWLFINIISLKNGVFNLRRLDTPFFKYGYFMILTFL
ncbi:hypothetical protein [Loigolactobacillus backii]|uniref:hypothetical protein n=1 Tax=Loigolactobacillus backii TaxID=375175 RepID=UPI000AF6C1B4|nr:hypothetical protein [Loigolactobacillus backii]